MQKKTNVCLGMFLMMSTVATGCFVSRKETVREVPVSSSSTTIERRSQVETVPQVDVVHRQTTVERTSY
jgi:hypothetical protein